MNLYIKKLQINEWSLNMKLKLALLLGTALNLLGNHADASDPQDDGRSSSSSSSQYNRVEEYQYMIEQLQAMGVDVSLMYATQDNEKDKKQPSGPQPTGDAAFDQAIQESLRDRQLGEEKDVEKLKTQSLAQEKQREEREIEKLKRLTLEEKKEKERRAAAFENAEREAQDRAFQISLENDKAKERLKEIDGELAQLAIVKQDGEATLKAATDAVAAAEGELESANETLEAAKKKCELPLYKGNPREEQRKKEAQDKVKELTEKRNTLSAKLEAAIEDNLTLTGALGEQEKALLAEKSKLDQKKS